MAVIHTTHYLTGKPVSRYIKGVTQDAIDSWRKSSTLIQYRFSKLSEADREFILLGISETNLKIFQKK